MKSKSHVAPAGAVTREYIKEIGSHKWLFSFVAVGTVGIQIAGLISPLFLRNLFNILATADTSASSVHEMFVTIVWIGVFLLLGWVMQRIQAVALMRLEARSMSNLYSTAFDRLIGHSYQFFISQFAGTLTRRVSKYSSAFETIFDSVAMTFAPALIYVVGAVIVLYLHNSVLGIVLGLWVLLFVAFQVYVSVLRQPLRMARAEEDSALTGAIADAIGNQSAIALFSGGEHEHGLMWAAILRWRTATLRSWTADDYIWGAQGFLMVIINIGLLWGALDFWQRGLLTVGDFVLIQSYLVGIFNNLNSMTRELRRVYDAFADAGEMVYILQQPYDVDDQPGAAALQVTDRQIVFDHVDFYFQEDRPILRDFNLTINGSEKVALVGPSGAGKSTVTKLLLRMYDVRRGAIEIDGQAIQTVTQDSLRRAISFVPQEPVLFHRSLLENIRYGRREASNEEVIEAAKKAHCHEFINSLPEGYETYVGERGIRLSGGERQRIAIARAILRDAPILVLDEATSSLDSESESFIQDALKTLMKGKTVIVIAHRLSTIMNMDRILVMQNGTIVSQGDHQQLLRSGGLYQKLWNIQAGGFLTEESQDQDVEQVAADAEEDETEESKGML